MRVKVNHKKEPIKAHISSDARYVCPWCWSVSSEPGTCKCGSELQKEKAHILFEYEN